MRKLSLAAVACMSMNACILSIDPVVTAQGATFDARLLGRWVESSSDNPDRAEITRGAGNDYVIQWTSGRDRVRMRGRLGELGGRTVLDVSPDPEDWQRQPYKDFYFRGHLLLVVGIGDDSVTTAILEPDTLKAAVKRKSLSLQLADAAFTEADALLNTTSDLRAVLAPYLARPGALAQPGVWRRVGQ